MSSGAPSTTNTDGTPHARPRADRRRQPLRPAFGALAGRGRHRRLRETGFDRRLGPFLRDRLDGRRAGSPHHALHVGLPAALPVLPQSRHLASQGRQASRAGAGGATAGRLCADAARHGRRPHHLGRRAAGADRLHRRHAGGGQTHGVAHRDRDRGLPGRACRRRLPREPRPGDPRHQERRPRDLPQVDRQGVGADPALRRAPECHGQAGLGPLRPGARPDRRARQRREGGALRGTDEERRMGRGAAVPSDGRLQVEVARHRLPARPHGSAERSAGENGSRYLPPSRLQGALMMAALGDLLASQPILSLFLAVALGYAVGQINIAGFSLGIGAVLFVGLAIGAIAPKAQITGPIGLIGLTMFLYGIGILYGRQFFEGLSGPGRIYNLLSFGAVIAALLVSLALGRLIGVGTGEILGVFAGSMTSTPTLQAALDLIGDKSPSIGYSVSYPFGVIGPILCFYFMTRAVKPTFPPAPERFHMAEITIERLPAGVVTLGDVMKLLPAGVQISSVRRDHHNQLPAESVMLRTGDGLLVPPEHIATTRAFFGDTVKAAAEFSYISVGLGMVLGVLLGLVPIPLPGVGTVTMGIGGGPLIVALIVGRLRRTGPITWVMPLPANIVLRNFGLTLFLATVGINSGQAFLTTVVQTGPVLLLVGAVVVLTTVLIVLLVGHFLLRIPYDDLLGIASGATGNPAILIYAGRMAPTERTNISYAMIFPSATLVKVVGVQIAGLVLLG